MSQQIINVGTNPNDGTGDPDRTAFTKCNSNFTELYNSVASRTRVIANTTISVNNTTGNDSTGGLTAPFKTWQAAVAFAFNKLDGAGFTLTLLGDGATYNAGIVINTVAVGWTQITIDGANATLNISGTHAIKVDAPVNNLTIQQFTLTTTTSGDCIRINPGASGDIFTGTNMVFGACAGRHINVGAPGATFWPAASYSVTGAAIAHMQVYEGGFINAGETSITVNFNNLALNFSQFTVYCESGTVDVSAIAWSGAGSVTGQRYFAFHGNIKTDNNGLQIPGNVDGFTIDGHYG